MKVALRSTVVSLPDIAVIAVGRDVARSMINHWGNNHDLGDIEENRLTSQI